MADQDKDSKTENASEKRVSEAMEQGQFAKSQELYLVFTLVAALAAFSFTAATSAQEVSQYAITSFSRLHTWKISIESVSGEFGMIMVLLTHVLLPIIVACAGAALLAGGLQSGFQLTPKAFGLKWEALNPASGMGRVFNKSSLVRTGIDILKIIAIALALWGGVRGIMRDPMFTAPVEVAYLGQFINQTTLALLSRLAFAIGLIAAISYAYEIFKTKKDLMMSRQELKDEHKNTEGDQMLKAAQRRLARRLMQKQMLAAVATADVVVTNPTHYAVALKYERGVDNAPVVLAKGENRFAQRIKAIAAENGVPTVENKPVARLLYAMGKVGNAIPSELYHAVAEILAVVYRTHRYYFFRLKERRAALPKAA